MLRITTNGRHLNVSLWLCWHSIFGGEEAKIIHQNVRWVFLLPSLRMESPVGTYGGQLGQRNRILEAYHMIQDDKDEHRYLVIDSGPRTPRLLQVRSHLHLPIIQHCYTHTLSKN